jgi:hypothetical protein
MTSPENVELAKALDEVSLEQALLDVDIANARVMDLTSRLVSARAEVAEARTSYGGELEFLRGRVADLEAQLEAIRSSRSYALVRQLAKLRSLLK